MADQIEELRLLAAIVEAGSMAGAARLTRRSPASVTRMLAALEARAGTRLFHRSTRKIVPTDAGRTLAARAQALVASYDEAFTGASAEKSAPHGLVRVTAPVLFGHMHLAPVVGEFLARHGEVRVELNLTNRLVDLIEEDQDVALRIGRLRNSRLVARPVGEIRRILVASPTYLAQRGMPRRIDDLRRHDLLLQSHDERVRRWLFGASRRRGSIEPSSRFVANDAQALIEAARAGHGIARVLSYQVDAPVRSGELVRLMPRFEPAALPVNVVYKGAQFLPARVRAFVEFSIVALRSRLEV